MTVARIQAWWMSILLVESLLIVWGSCCRCQVFVDLKQTASANVTWWDIDDHCSSPWLLFYFFILQNYPLHIKLEWVWMKHTESYNCWKDWKSKMMELKIWENSLIIFSVNDLCSWGWLFCLTMTYWLSHTFHSLSRCHSCLTLTGS